MASSLYDVIVVGAGIAGLRCAELLAEAGVSCCLLEKNSCVGGYFGENMEGFPAYQHEQLDFEIPSSPVTRISLWAGATTKIKFEFSEPVLRLVKRGPADDSIDSYLLNRALRAGAEIKFGERVVGITGSKSAQEITTEAGGRHHSRIVVGADGVFSSVRRLLGLGLIGTHGVGYIAKMASTNVSPSEIVGVFSYKVAPNAYGYVIGYPEENYATVGLTVRPDYVNRPLEEYFAALTTYLSDLTAGAKVVETFRGFVTCGDGSQEIVKSNTLFIGEAGGFQDPVMGFGMTPALRSAKLAAEVATRALLRNDLDVLDEFRRKAREIIVKNEASQNWGFRDAILESVTDEDMEALVRLLGKHPATFERILRTGKYKGAALRLILEAVILRPQLTLMPLRYLRRKLFGEQKIPP